MGSLLEVVDSPGILLEALSVVVGRGVQGVVLSKMKFPRNEKKEMKSLNVKVHQGNNNST